MHEANRSYRGRAFEKRFPLRRREPSKDDTQSKNGSGENEHESDGESNLINVGHMKSHFAVRRAAQRRRFLLSGWLTTIVSRPGLATSNEPSARPSLT